MFKAQVGNSNKSIIGGVNGEITGRYGLSASTNSKPTTSLTLEQSGSSATGAVTGAADGRSVTRAADGRSVTRAADGRSVTGAADGRSVTGRTSSKKSTFISLHPIWSFLQALSEYVHAFTV